MPRCLRCNSGGYVYHALNRAVGRATLLNQEGDYAAFEKVLRQREAELEALRRAVVRGCPYGGGGWVDKTARRLGLEATLRPRGRPSKRIQEVAK